MHSLHRCIWEYASGALPYPIWNRTSSPGCADCVFVELADAIPNIQALKKKLEHNQLTRNARIACLYGSLTLSHSDASPSRIVYHSALAAAESLGCKRCAKRDFTARACRGGEEVLAITPRAVGSSVTSSVHDQVKFRFLPIQILALGIIHPSSAGHNVRRG